MAPASFHLIPESRTAIETSGRPVVVIQAGAPLFAGANSDGSVYYVVLLLTSQSNLKSFIAETAPVLQSIHWNLT